MSSKAVNRPTDTKQKEKVGGARVTAAVPAMALTLFLFFSRRISTRSCNGLACTMVSILPGNPIDHFTHMLLL